MPDLHFPKREQGNDLCNQFYFAGLLQATAAFYTQYAYRRFGKNDLIKFKYRHWNYLCKNDTLQNRFKIYVAEELKIGVNE